MFENKEINSILTALHLLGKVSQEFGTEILDNLVALKNAEYTNKQHTKICIYWRSIVAWANLIYQYVETTGQSNGSILTLYDLQESDETDGEGMNYFLSFCITLINHFPFLFTLCF